MDLARLPIGELVCDGPDDILGVLEARTVAEPFELTRQGALTEIEIVGYFAADGNYRGRGRPLGEVTDEFLAGARGPRR